MSANPSLRASSSAALSNSLPQHLHSTSSAEQLIFTVDSFDNGVAFGSHKKESHQDSRDCFALRVHEDSDLVKLRSRYTLHRKNLLHELERRLMRISDSGRLASSTIYFGVATDPFHPFEGKFDASMRFLELFKRYTPGKLIIQTRSPLLVLAMPIFQRLGEHVALTIGVETHCDRMAQRYTPHLPRPSERLKAALTLKLSLIHI